MVMPIPKTPMTYINERTRQYEYNDMYPYTYDSPRIHATRHRNGWEIELMDGRKIVPYKYIVTGKDVYGKRFRQVYGSESLHFALGINLYRGSVWGLYENKRILLKRVCN